MGFSYLRRGVCLHGCSSKAQLLLLTLGEVYLLTATPPDLGRGVVPLGPPVSPQLVPLMCPSTPRALSAPAQLSSPGCRLYLPHTPPSPLCTPTVRLHSWPWSPRLPVSIPAPKATRGVVSIPCLLSVWQSCQDYCSCKLHNPPQQAETLRTRSGPRLEFTAPGWDPLRPLHSKAASSTAGPLPLSCRGHAGYFCRPFKTGKCPHTLWSQPGHEAIADPSLSLEG